MPKIDSDWQRVKRQRNVIQAAVNSTKDLSISELNDLMNQVFPLVQTNLSKLEITELLMLAPKCRGASIQQITIPIKDSYGGMTGLGGRRLFQWILIQTRKLYGNLCMVKTRIHKYLQVTLLWG